MEEEDDAAALELLFSSPIPFDSGLQCFLEHTVKGVHAWKYIQEVTALPITRQLAFCSKLFLGFSPVGKGKGAVEH